AGARPRADLLRGSRLEGVGEAPLPARLRLRGRPLRPLPDGQIARDMDLLKRRLVRTALFVGVPIVVAACLPSGGSRSAPPRPASPQAKHGEDLGLECSSCHRDALTGDPAGMPSPQQCRLCHRDLDQDKPPERQAAAFFENGALKGPSLTALSAE